MTPGRDAVLHCEGPVPGVLFELLRAGEEDAVARASSTRTAANLVLIAVGPRHTGNYSCRYRGWRPVAFESLLSEPVELRVSGEAPASLGPRPRITESLPSSESREKTQDPTCFSCYV